MFIRETSTDMFGDLKSLSAHVMGDSVLISYPDNKITLVQRSDKIEMVGSSFL